MTNVTHQSAGGARGAAAARRGAALQQAAASGNKSMPQRQPQIDRHMRGHAGAGTSADTDGVEEVAGAGAGAGGRRGARGSARIAAQTVQMRHPTTEKVQTLPRHFLDGADAPPDDGEGVSTSYRVWISLSM